MALYRVTLKTGTVDTIDFQDFALINSYLVLLDRASFPHYNNTKIIKIIWLRTFYFMSNFLYGLSFRDFPDFQSSEARLMTASAVHKLSEYCVQ